MHASSEPRNDSLTTQGLTPAAASRYLNGAPPESDQFDFFIGDWDCELRLHAPGAEAPATLRGEWRAKWLHDRRILVDDLSVFLPSGEEVLGWVNLRTFSAESGHWEITGQRALEPASGALTSGRWIDGEMRLAFETDQGGRALHHRVRFFAIRPGSFEWEWESRVESSAGWNAFATLSATRMAGT